VKKHQIFVRDKEFYGNIVKIAVPIVLQSLITIGVNMMDTMMLGNYGEYQLSGASLANEFIAIYQIMCMGLGYGAAVLTSQFWGNQDIPALKKVVTIMLRIGFTVSCIFNIITFVAPGAIMRIYAEDALIIENGIKYFRISAFTFIPMGISLTLTAILRSVREVKGPLYISIIAFFVNIFFNWVFIFGNLGAPEMQVAGAALGTLIARIFEAGATLFIILKLDQKIKYKIKDFFEPCADMFRLYLKFCVPVLISDTLLALGNSAVSIVMGHMGASFVAANAIVAQTTRMSTVFTQGVSSSASVLTGNTLGSGDREKTYRQGITFWALGIIIGLFAAVVFLAISPLIISQFKITEETVEVAYKLMFAASLMIVFQSMQSMLTKGILRGGGDTKFLMVGDILFLWIVSVPLGYVTGLVWHMDAFWVYSALKADWVIKSLLCTWRLFSKKWMKQAKHA